MSTDNGTRMRVGQIGVAVACSMDDETRARFPASIANWLIEARNVHPFWQHWHLSAISLADFPGHPPAVIDEPGVTHELALWALDPEPGPLPDRPDTWWQLLPVNFIFQFVASSDERARAFCDAIAGALVNGQMLLEPLGVRGARDAHAQILMLALEEIDPTPDDAPARPCHLGQP